ncbi:MAG: carboxypeptidase regulatory-like domain-containing protein [Armatimonadetes bacterium]|nr:carboxypeptidase regulatory-like domain-containing protein [Armatimonadota bacterium]MDE2205399.1 carboxypeptidase regulatory-like domain-containing protein [Armatimonadota bacterium]
MIAIAVAMLPFVVSGCGGSSGFTGGSFPPALVGRVVDATSPVQKPIPGASVVITAVPQSGRAVNLSEVTNATGSFYFPRVDLGAATGAVTVSITPPTNAYRPEQVSFVMQQSINGDLLVCLDPSVGGHTGASLALPVESFKVGQTASLNAQLLDAAGKAVAVQPTVLALGNLGVVNPDGTFTAIASGSGVVAVFWYALPPVTQAITVTEPPVSTAPSGGATGASSGGTTTK